MDINRFKLIKGKLRQNYNPVEIYGVCAGIILALEKEQNRELLDDFFEKVSTQ